MDGDLHASQFTLSKSAPAMSSAAARESCTEAAGREASGREACIDGLLGGHGEASWRTGWWAAGWWAAGWCGAADRVEL